MRLALIALLPIWIAAGATFGDVVVIGGQAADIALDESRGLLYIANFTAGRIDVLTLSGRSIQTSIHVAAGPSSLALSRDNRFLVVTHFGNQQAPSSPSNAVTILDLEGGSRQTLALAHPPLGVAFGIDNLALVATTGEFLLLDPRTGKTDLIDTVAGVTANTMPVAPGIPPVQVTAASVASSGDGRWLFGFADTIRFSFEVASRRLQVTGYSATPALGPRVVSVSTDGSYYAIGWAVLDRRGTVLSQFPNAAGLLAAGSHAIDSRAGIIYAQVPAATAAVSAPPALSIRDADNLAVRELLQLPENLTGRSVLDARMENMYSVSESGVVILPVGSLGQWHRLAADREDLVFQGNFCQQGASTRSVTITDPGGGQTDVSLSSDLSGVRISPTSGKTPLTVQITIDPRAFQDRRGTTTGWLTLTSETGVNLPPPIRILINNQRPDERGSLTAVHGVVSDALADPVRDRFYVVRQDRNQVVAYDGSGLFPVTTLRTANTPTQLAMTLDGKYLLIGHDNAQLVYVYDLDTLQQQLPVVMPAGHYPRSIAVSGNAILSASRVVGSTNAIDRVDLISHMATALPSLGVFQNTLATDTVLAGSPGGSTILVASADGMVLKYDAAADTFTASRKVGPALSGAFAASDSGRFVVGNHLLNGSLVQTGTWNGTDPSLGFVFQDGGGLLITGPSTGQTAGGTIQRIDTSSGARIRPTRITEQPLAAAGSSAFTRGLAALSNRTKIIALTTSGFTAMAWDYDAAVVPPSIREVVNAADLTPPVAPGSLVSVFGTNLSPTNLATLEIPLPTAIGESCLTVNGSVMPMLFVSPGQINAQMPLHVAGRVPLTLYTPGGISDDYYLDLLPAAPAVFRSGTAGPLTGLPVIVKTSNQQLVTPSNPIHAGDEILIYATGLGATSPEVEAGMPPLAEPLAVTVGVPDVRLGGIPLFVRQSSLAPGMVGVYEVRVRAPDPAPAGNDVPLTITQSGVTATIPVRVVD